MTDRFEDWRAPEITDGVPTEYNWVVQHISGFSLGLHTDIGAFTYINAKNGVTIADEVQIGSHCSIYSVSTIDSKHGPVIMERACRVGSHSVIMPQVTIGRGAVIGAMSFVTKDIPAGALAYGVPATVVGRADVSQP